MQITSYQMHSILECYSRKLSRTRRPDEASPQRSRARTAWIHSMSDAGITSIAIDASPMPDDRNLLAGIALSPCVLRWAGLETEVSEIKGKQGLSTPAEALFLIQGTGSR